MEVRPQLMITADKIIFNFENHPDRAKSSMLDMIQLMPLIGKDPFDGRIYVEAPHKTYIVLRKGREDALFNFGRITFEELIQRLPAMGFTTFEIWTVVPERYKSYDYVINILPDPTQRLFGAVGANTVDYDARSGGLTLSQAVNGSADKIRFSTNLSFLNRNAPKTKNDVSTLFYPTQTMEELQITQNAVTRSSGETWNAGLMTSIDITKKQFINIGIKGNIGDSRTIKTTDTDSLYGGIHSLMHNLYRSTSEIKNWELTAAYQFDFKKRYRMFDISYLMSSDPIKNDVRLFTEYETAVGNDHGQMKSSRGKNTTQRLQLNYGDVFRDGKCTFTSQAGYLSTNEDRKNFVFDLPSEKENTEAYTRMEQNIQRLDGYIFASYSLFKRLSASATLRSDYLLNDQTAKATTGDAEKDIHQKKLLINGGGGFTFKFNIKQPEKGKQTPTTGVPMSLGAGNARFGNSSVSLNYNLVQRRPSISQITNYVSADNSLSVRRGNPNLKLENIHIFKMGFNSWFIKFDPDFMYSFSNNKIVERTFSETDENGTRIVTSYDNSGKDRNFSFIGNYYNMAGMMPQPKPFGFRFHGIMGTCNIGKTDYGDGAFSKNYSIDLRTMWMLTIQKFRANIQLTYSDYITKGAYGSRKENPFILIIDFRSNKKIGDVNFRYNVAIGNLLNIDNRSRSTVNMPDFERVSKSSTIKIPVSVGFSFSYGKFVVKPVRNARKKATVEGFSQS